MTQRLAWNFLEKLFLMLKKNKAPSKYIYLKSLLLHFSKNALKSAHFTFLQLKKKSTKLHIYFAEKHYLNYEEKIHLMETIFSQILFLSILSIFVLQTNSIEKLYLSSHFQKMKNYLKHNSLLSKANTLITKTKILRYLAGH